MALDAGQDAALAHRANLNIASAVVAKLGTGASDSLIDHVINDVRASHPIAELASAGGMSMVIGAVDTAIARNIETNRPFNTTDSRAAQLAAHGGSHGGHWHGDGNAFSRYGLLMAGRGGRDGTNDSGEGSGASGSGASRSGGYATSGSEPAGAPFWGSAKGMMLTRSYANDNGMDWAPQDLMKMGRPALQALKDSGLKGDGYKALHNPSGLNLCNATIVHGSQHYMKRFHLNHNDAAKAADKLYHNPALQGDLQKEVHGATEQAEKASNEKEYQAAKDRVGKARGRIHREAPDAAKDADAWAEKYGADKNAGLDAKAGAKKDDAEAKQKDAKADAKGQETDKKNDEMVALLRSRSKPAAPAPGK